MLRLILWLVVIGFCVGGFRHTLKRFTIKPTGGHSFKLSPMVDSLVISRTNEIHSLIKDMERGGETVCSLCVGEPKYDPPPEVVNASITAVRTGLTKYTPVAGETAFRDAIAEDFTIRKGIICTSDQIVVTNGAKQGVLQALMSVVKPGDKVLLPAPYWTSYPDMVKMCYGEPVILPTDAGNNFCLQPEVLRQTLLNISTHGGLVACIILCNPHNPTGSVPTRLQLEALAEVLRDYPQVVVISDEIYERLLHDDAEHTSIASLEGMSERTVTVNGPSKAFSMTGFRIGYCVAPLVLAKAMGKLQSQITSCASSISQYAALAALTVVGKTNPNWLPSHLAELTTQRDLAHKLLVAIPYVHCTKPNGAFYLFPDVSHYFGKRLVGEGGRESVVIGDAHQLCVELLRSQHVALVPGDAFGAPNNVRLCYAADQCTIKEAIGGLNIFLESLR